MNAQESNLKKLSKEELIKLIDSYKERIVTLEEYNEIVRLNQM